MRARRPRQEEADAMLSRLGTGALNLWALFPALAAERPGFGGRVTELAGYLLACVLLALLGPLLALAARGFLAAVASVPPHVKEILRAIASRLLWNICEALFKAYVWPRVWPPVVGALGTIWFLMLGPPALRLDVTQHRLETAPTEQPEVAPARFQRRTEAPDADVVRVPGAAPRRSGTGREAGESWPPARARRHECARDTPGGGGIVSGTKKSGARSRPGSTRYRSKSRTPCW
jgi:hypothetical protein